VLLELAMDPESRLITEEFLTPIPQIDWFPGDPLPLFIEEVHWATSTCEHFKTGPFSVP